VARIDGKRSCFEGVKYELIELPPESVLKMYKFAQSVKMELFDINIMLTINNVPWKHNKKIIS